MPAEPMEPPRLPGSAKGEQRGESPPPGGGRAGKAGGYGYPLPDLAEVVVTAVGTAAVLPFVQALATQAGTGAFEAARRLVARWVREPGSGMPPVVDRGERLRVTDEGCGRLSFEVPAGLPDVALEALTRTDLEALAALPPEGGRVQIRWDAAAREWKRDVI
ncbi:hypothetical protein [Streptomyces sp. NPDC005865]|uniref:hypothetical protein n=1 Tax=Streptomyces sp. NPDC005865 TaxID=3155453 RepID=UPI0033D53E00